MRILLVYDHLDVGGAQTHGLGLSKFLMRAGHAVAVVSRGGCMQALLERQGGRHIQWPAPRRTDVVGLALSLRAANAIIRAWQPDVIHAHAVLPALLFKWASAVHQGGKPIPVVVTPHRSWRSVYRFPGGRLVSAVFHELLRSNADHIVAISEGVYRELAQHGVSAARCTLIPNGVDMDAIDEAAVRPAFNGLSDAKRSVGLVGRLMDQKGLDTFISAAGLVLKKFPQTSFAIVGDGPLRADCMRRIALLGITDHVLLLGERGDVPKLLPQMSVFVSASRWEGMPYALLEALAARRPVVATRVPGSSELIHDGEHGLLVPPGDPQAMSDAIIRLLDDRELAGAFGAAGRRWVESRHNLRSMTDQVLALYGYVVVRAARSSP